MSLNIRTQIVSFVLISRDFRHTVIAQFIDLYFGENLGLCITKLTSWYKFCVHHIWRSSGLSGLTTIVFNIEFTHLGLKAFIFAEWYFRDFFLMNF